ncbi:sulfatase [Phycisphaerales bacterium AB-hyl4]|uniref:Sulfatase n=1 Tax=Natronomicrosphaera hydrolytica TaxID=3242702 RepID=A0ABV4U4R0_9BACT
MRILYVDIDSLKPSHLGCYGYSRPTSPTMDALAARGVRFNHCYAADSPCVPSRAAMWSGRPGIRNGVVTHENTPAGCAFRYAVPDRHGQCPTLAHHLADAGLQTVSFTSFADRHLQGWFNFGFREFHVPSLKGGNEDGPEVNAAVLPWLRDHAREDNWFVHLTYWDPHTLYTEPMDQFEAMARHPAAAWPDEQTIERQQRDTGIRTASTLWGDNPHDGFGRSRVPTMPDNIRNRSDFEHLINGYDGGIRHADDQLAELVAELDRQGVLEETAIIISADHGEAFGELGQYMEHGSASPATHHIPLIVVWPGITDAAAGTARDEMLLNTDFAPTLAELLELDVPEGWCGRSFAPALQGQAMHLDEPLVWTHGLHTRQRAVFDGRYLFIRTYHPSWYAYPPRMLFDLEQDPHQQHDLADELPDRVSAMGAQLTAWEQAHVDATGQPDPMRLAQHQPPAAAGLPDYLERLEKLGRAEDAKAIRERLARVPTHYAPPALEPKSSSQ